MWKWFIIFGLLLVGLIPLPVLALTTADVVITATGIVVASPGNFTLTYISDYEVGISWTLPVGVANTMIRVATGRIPIDRNDGYLVYYGAGTGFTDTNVDLTSFEMPFYRAWSQRADGVWEEIGTNKAADFMSQAWLFVGTLIFLAIALAFSIYYFTKKQIILSIIGGFLWFLFVVFMYSHSTGWDIYRGFAAMGFLMALMSWIIPLAWRQSLPGEEEPPTESGVDRYIRRRDKIREATRKIRGD